MEQTPLQALLSQEVEPGAVREALTAMGLAPTYENAIHLQIHKKAAGGDFTAAKYVLEAARAGQEEESSAPALEALRAMPTEALARLAGEAP